MTQKWVKRGEMIHGRKWHTAISVHRGTKIINLGGMDHGEYCYRFARQKLF